MGNLRNKYTDDEWNQLEKEIATNKKNGKPDDSIISLSIWNKDVDQLKKLRIVLSDFFNDYDLSLITNWIEWKEKANSEKIQTGTQLDTYFQNGISINEIV
jgi:hypothetical protein